MSAPTRFDALQAALSEAIYELRDRPRIELHELVAAGLQHDAALFTAMDDDERRAVIKLAMNDVPIAPGALGWLQIDLVARGPDIMESVADGIARVARAHPEVEDVTPQELRAFADWATPYSHAEVGRLNEKARRLGVDQTFVLPPEGATSDRKH